MLKKMSSPPTRFLSDFFQFNVDMVRTKQIHTAQTTEIPNTKQLKCMLNSAFILYNMLLLFIRYFTFKSWFTMVAVDLKAVFWYVEATGEWTRN